MDRVTIELSQFSYDELHLKLSEAIKRQMPEGFTLNMDGIDIQREDTKPRFKIHRLKTWQGHDAASAHLKYLAKRNLHSRAVVAECKVNGFKAYCIVTDAIIKGTKHFMIETGGWTTERFIEQKIELV